MVDFFTTMVPFLFVVAIVYGALEVSGVFKNPAVKAIIAFSLAFFTISSATTLAFINNIIPYAAVFFIGFFLLGFMLSFFRGKKKEGGGDKDWTLIAIVVLLIAVFLTNYGIDWLGTNFPNIDSDNFIAAAGVGLILIIFYAVYQKGREKG